MILRMYELAAADMERLAGWPGEAGSFAGPIRALTRDRLAIELAIASTGRTGRELTQGERQGVMRRLIPWVARRLMAEGIREKLGVVARLDGRLQPGSLIEAIPYLDPSHAGLFNFTGASRLSPSEPFPAASISMVGDVEMLGAICADQAVALHGGVRLRAFMAPAETASALLTLTQPDDGRWEDHLSTIGFFLGPSASMESLFVIGPANAEELRHTLTQPAEE
jgi:hypothetical protein